MEKTWIARDGRTSADSGAWKWTCTGVSAFFAMSIILPHCLSALQLDGRGQFSETILAFYRRLWFMAKMALESTGSTVISFSSEDEAKLLGVSPTTIRNWIGYLIANGVLIPRDRKGGRGKKALYVFHIKTQHQKAIAVSLDYSTTPYGQPDSTSDAPPNTPLPNCPEEPLPSYPKLSPAQQRAEKLRKLPDDTPLQGKTSNWVLEQFRHRCMDMGFTREESDILCNYVGRLIQGKTLGDARKVARWFWQQTRTVLRKLREAAKNGLRAAYAMLGYLFRKALGILKPPSRPRKKQPSTAPKPWRWDLNDPEERAAFLHTVGSIIQQGGGICPRCGNVIRVEYWAVSSALAFQDPDGCRCLYIALDRDIRDREKRPPLEKETRGVQWSTNTEPGGLVKTLGDVLHGLLGGGKEPQPDPEGERLLALQDPEEIHRIALKSLGWDPGEAPRPPPSPVVRLSPTWRA